MPEEGRRHPIREWRVGSDHRVIELDAQARLSWATIYFADPDVCLEYGEVEADETFIGGKAKNMRE